jgi:PAS domain-containing protein
MRRVSRAIAQPRDATSPGLHRAGARAAIGSSHFAELLDFLPDVLAWVKDRQGRYLWVNRAFVIQYALDHPRGHESVSVESILGKTDYDLSPAFLADQFRHDDEQVLAGHRIVNRLERLEESRGATVWNITDKIPVVDAKGAIIGTAGITRAAESATSLEATSASRPSRTCRCARSNAGSAPPFISRRRDFCASFGCVLRVAR